MAAEFHLAEYALALHLLLEHPERLIDIVVTNKNLHAVLLFDCDDVERCLDLLDLLGLFWTSWALGRDKLPISR